MLKMDAYASRQKAAALMVTSSNIFSRQSDECLKILLEREAEHMPKEDYTKQLWNGCLDASIRTSSIDWILKTSRTELHREHCPFIDAKSFLFHILRSVPSAFPRIASLHFLRSIYEPEILHLERSLQTIYIACDELRTWDLFIKLLEAILKAGNRMNAGTSCGNAQAFDPTALCKLSDVKSTEGKTTLLHFVVQEVARSEGKRRSALSKSSSFRRSSSLNHRIYAMEQEEREREYMMLGLPIVGGLSE